MSRLFLKTLIKGQHPLLPLIYEFNMRPARYVHESWLDSITDALMFRKLVKSRRGEKWLSTLILKKFHLDGDYWFDFEDQRRRVALIDTESLGKLVFLAGVAVNVPVIAKTVEREALLRLRGEIGDDAYQFALKKAPFLIGRMTFPFMEDRAGDNSRSHLISCGMKCLSICFAGDPGVLTRRLFLKLPKEFSHDMAGGEVEEGDKKRAWALLRKVLLQEVEPGWAACFS